MLGSLYSNDHLVIIKVHFVIIKAQAKDQKALQIRLSTGHPAMGKEYSLTKCTLIMTQPASTHNHCK